MKRLDNLYLKTIQPLLILLVVTFPLANSDLFSIFHPKLYPSRIVLAIIVGISGSCLVAAGLKGGLRQISISAWFQGFWGRIKKDYILALLLFLLLVRAISIKSSLNFGASISILGYFASVVVLYLVLGWISEIKPQFLKDLYRIHVGMVSLVAIYAVTQLGLLLAGIKLPGVLYGQSFLRIPGTFYDANHLPPYILTSLPFVLVLAWRERNFYKKSGLIILAGAQGLALVLTFSRSGFLGLAISAFALTLFLVKFKMWRKVGLIAVALVIFLFFAYLSTRTNYSFFERALSVFNPGEKSTSSHGLLYAGAIDLFTQHPLLGVGYGGFSEHFRASRWGIEHGYIDPATHVRVPAHSLWFEALAETGLLGIIPFLILLAIFFHLPNRAFNIIKSRRQSLEFAGLISGAAGVLTGSIFYSYHLEFFWFFLFFVALYSRRVLARQEKEAFVEEKFVAEKIPWREIIPLVAIGVWGGVFVFWGIWSGRLVTETEGIYAWIAKFILRAGFRDWENWWVPVYRESFWFEKPPFYLWLSAAAMFLYYITTFSARFWAAFAGFGTVVATYILGRLMFNRYKGILAAMLIVFWPVFVLYSHRGELVSWHLLLMVLGILFLWLARRSSIFWLFLGLAQGVFFWFDARAAIASFAIIVSVFLIDTVLIEKRWKTGSLLFLLGFIPTLFPWPILMNRKFSSEFLNPYIDSMRFLPLRFDWWEIVAAGFALTLVLWSLRIFRIKNFEPKLRKEVLLLASWLLLSCFATSLVNNGLLIIVPLALLVSHLVTEFALRTRFLKYASVVAIGVGAILICSLTWYKILPPSPYDRVLEMLDFRYGQDPDGNNRNYLVEDYSPILEYYSDTPITLFESNDDLYENLVAGFSDKEKKDKRRAYYLVDGYWFKEIVSDARSKNIGLRVLLAQGTTLLVEKY